MNNKTIIRTKGPYNFSDHAVYITNDGDDWFYEQVKDWRRLNEIIDELKAAGREVFGEDYSEADFDE